MAWELGPVARRSFVAVVLSALVLAVYGLATLVLGGGEVVATAVVAVLLLPLRSRLERFVNRLLRGPGVLPRTPLGLHGGHGDGSGPPAGPPEPLAPSGLPSQAARRTSPGRSPRPHTLRRTDPALTEGA